MTADKLRKFWHRAPCAPFDVVVPGRKKLHVPHPDFLIVSPHGRIAHVWTRGNDYAAMDVLLITAVEKNSRRANGTRRKRSPG